MSIKRLQVLFDEKELRILKRHALEAQMPLGVWVRQALRRVTDQESTLPITNKLKALAIATKSEFPTGEASEIKHEIVSGYLKSWDKR